MVVALVWGTRRGTPIAAALKRSVIVLPFENSSRDTTQEYFADGLTDELTGLFQYFHLDAVFPKLRELRAHPEWAWVLEVSGIDRYLRERSLAWHAPVH